MQDSLRTLRALLWEAHSTAASDGGGGSGGHESSASSAAKPSVKSKRDNTLIHLPSPGAAVWGPSTPTIFRLSEVYYMNFLDNWSDYLCLILI